MWEYSIPELNNYMVLLNESVKETNKEKSSRVTLDEFMQGKEILMG